MSEPQVLIISHDRVGSQMAGPGIRAWEMARTLARQQPVTLLAPGPLDLSAPELRLASYTPGDAAALAPFVQAADLLIANLATLSQHPELTSIAQPLALDLYDPIALENLELLRELPPEARAQRAELDAALLRAALLRGDCLLCATERQRDLYLGGLLALGRLGPELADADPLLRRLLVVAPFGLPSEPPPAPQPVLRGVLPGLGPGHKLVVWSGGLWEWLDPLALIRATALLRERLPELRVVFLAGAHPGLALPGSMPERARALAAELELLGTRVFFYEHWVHYERRADVLAEADVLAYLHREHLESAYAAVRSRFLDHLWVGRASLVSAGDAAAELVARHGLGVVAPAGDEQALAEALARLLADDVGRAAMAERARSLASDWTWQRTLAPLRAFCARPGRVHSTKLAETDMHKQASELSTGDGASPQPRPEYDDPNVARNALLGQIDSLWQVRPQELGSALPLLAQAKQAANSLTRWYVQGIVEQQNAFNAAVVQALQAIADSDDRRHSLAIGSAAEAHEALAELRRQMATQQEWTANISAALQSLHKSILALESRLAPISQHIADIEQHLLDLDEAQTELALRLTALPEAASKP